MNFKTWSLLCLQLKNSGALLLEDCGLTFIHSKSSKQTTSCSWSATFVAFIHRFLTNYAFTAMESGDGVAQAAAQTRHAMPRRLAANRVVVPARQRLMPMPTFGRQPVSVVAGQVVEVS